jgi:two-component system, NarL family, response regulator
MKRASNSRTAKGGRVSARARKTIGSKIRILLADDHHVVRQGLAAIIGTEPDLHIVGEACDGETACQLYFQLRPDVLILDLRMPILDGFGVVKRVITEHPQAHILIITTYETDEDVWRCLRAGALGYVLKDATQPEIIAAIRAVAAGESFTTPRLALKLARRASAPELTRREQQVLSLLATGQTNKQIAAAIEVGEGTVKTHVKNLLQKLNARTRTEAARIAEDGGLLH